MCLMQCITAGAAGIKPPSPEQSQRGAGPEGEGKAITSPGESPDLNSPPAVLQGGGGWPTKSDLNPIKN